MWISFGIPIAISGLIYQVECMNTPYSDMYLPNGTNGFVCRIDFLTIEYARQLAIRALESFFFDKHFQKYPKLFEDTHLFNVNSDILLSWPARSSAKGYIRGNPGKTRLIINTRGQIMGMAMITFKDQSQKVEFEKCSPVRRSRDEETIESKILDEHCAMAYARYGYNCGLKFFPVSTIKSGKDLDSKDYYENLRKSKHMLPHLKKFEGNEFVGDDLYVHPVQPKLSSRVTSGPPGPFRVVFDMKNCEFKGIINLENRKDKCVTVWDLSSTPPDYTYSQSSILNIERIKDSYWPETCFGHKFKYKTIWLYIEFALKNWSPNYKGGNSNFPLVTQKVIRFWPMRTPENRQNSLNYAFAVGYNTNLETYGLYQADVRDGVLSNFKLCLNLPLKEIRSVQKLLGPTT